MKTLRITKQEEGQTIYKFIKKHLHGAPLSFVEKLFRLKDVKVNKKRVDKSFVISCDDLVEIYLNDQQYDEFTSQKEEVKLTQMPNVVYEDEISSEDTLNFEFRIWVDRSYINNGHYHGVINVEEVE